MALLPASMPPSFLLAAFLLISHLAAQSHAKTFTRTIPDSDLRLNCALTLGGYGYNLCSLVRKTVAVEEIEVDDKNEDESRGEGPSSGRRFFDVNLGGLPIGVRESMPSGAAHCDEDTWVCLTNMVVTNARETNNMKIAVKPFPIARRIETESRNGILATLEEQDTGMPPLRLTMTGGIRDGVLQSAEIVLYCSKTEKLRYINEDHGLHSFVWETRHACPKTYPRSAASKISIAEEAEDNTGQPPGDKAEKGEGDLMPPQGMSKIRKFIIVALIILLVPSICGFVLFSSTRARNFTIEKFHTALLPFLSKVAIKLRPIGNTIHTLTSQSIGRLKSPFRQGEGQLVQWAQEDMTLADSEDTMVNGSLDAEGWDADGMEEYIPLTISPKHGRSRRIRSYGATPDVETFAERQQGPLSAKIGKYFKR